jgi:hypothetical protein
LVVVEVVYAYVPAAASAKPPPSYSAPAAGACNEDVEGHG